VGRTKKQQRLMRHTELFLCARGRRLLEACCRLEGAICERPDRAGKRNRRPLHASEERFAHDGLHLIGRGRRRFVGQRKRREGQATGARAWRSRGVSDGRSSAASLSSSAPYTPYAPGAPGAPCTPSTPCAPRCSPCRKRRTGAAAPGSSDAEETEHTEQQAAGSR